MLPSYKQNYFPCAAQTAFGSLIMSSDVFHQSVPELKLPRIDRPNSRSIVGSVLSHEDPTIKLPSVAQQNDKPTQSDFKSKNAFGDEHLGGGRKLKNILADQQDQYFIDRINENKDIIKRFRLNKAPQLAKAQVITRPTTLSPNVINERVAAEESQKPHPFSNLNKKPPQQPPAATQRNKKVKQKSTHEVEPQPLVPQKSSSSLRDYGSAEQLFESIHNFLENPIKKLKMKHNPKKLQLLEQKLKAVEKQLETNNKQPLRSEMIQTQDGNLQPQACKQQLLSEEDEPALKPAQSQAMLQRVGEEEKEQRSKSRLERTTVTNWRRISFDQSNMGKGGIVLRSSQSTFEREVERMNKYFERNELTLKKYMENQKNILEIKMSSGATKNTKSLKLGATERL